MCRFYQQQADEKETKVKICNSDEVSKIFLEHSAHI